MAAIDDMKDEIRLDDVFESTAKRGNQMMWKLTNEADGVDEEDRCRPSQIAFAKL